MNDFTLFDQLDKLDAETKALVSTASKAAKNAYAPYSNFHVGAAVLLDDGTVITGTNQENAAYPAGMCAERVALYALAATHPGKSIRKMAVIAKRHNDDNLVPATSCGQCRQVMLEFEQRQSKPFEVIMQNQQKQWVVASAASALLPFSFGKESLHPNR